MYDLNLDRYLNRKKAKKRGKGKQEETALEAVLRESGKVRAGMCGESLVHADGCERVCAGLGEGTCIAVCSFCKC
eukprot:343660-Chlamydomonas_euryale.AAC.5